MKIVRLTAENVKRLSAVEIAPDGNVVVIGGKNGQGKCLPEGTPVSLWDGSQIPIEDVRETHFLVGLNPVTHRLVAENPRKLWTSGVQECFELVLKSGDTITATAGHRLLSEHGWKPISELSPGELLACPLRLPCLGRSSSRDELAKAMLIGLLLGDGCLSGGAMVLSCEDESVLGEFKLAVQTLFPNARVAKNGASSNYRVSERNGSGEVAHGRFLREHGMWKVNSYSVAVPNALYSWGREAIIHFLAGLFMTDGYVRESGWAQLAVRSKELAHGARHCLKLIGVASTSRVKHVAGKPVYVVSVVSEGVPRFAEQVLPLIPTSRLNATKIRSRHATRGNGPASGPKGRVFCLPSGVATSLVRDHGVKSLRPWVDRGRRISRDVLLRDVGIDALVNAGFEKYVSPDIGWSAIESIQSVGMRQTFDLEMPSQAFIANSFLVHNSSCLDSIVYALRGGRSIPSHVVRDGTEKAEIIIQTDSGLVVRRIIRANGTISLEVRQVDSEGMETKVVSPQGLLDKLIGEIAFDPLAFTRLRPAEQVAMLSEVVKLNLGPIDAEIQAAFDSRKEVARKVRDAEGSLRALPHHDDVGTEERSAAKLAAKVREIAEENASRQKVAEEVQRAKSSAAEAEAKAKEAVATFQSIVEEGKAEVARIEKLLEETRARYRDRATAAKEMAAEATSKAKSAIAAANGLASRAIPEEVSDSEVQQQIQEIDTYNAKVRDNVAYHRQSEELELLKKKNEELDERVQSLRDKRLQMMADAKWPIEGLGFGDDGVTYKNRPFHVLSSAEQLRISTAIAFSTGNKLPIAMIRDGSLLDDDSLAEVAKIAAKYDGQVWIERVSTGEECSVVIEAGSIKETVGAADE